MTERDKAEYRDEGAGYETAAAQDGQFCIVETDVGVFISVSPPLNGGQAVRDQDVINDLVERRVNVTSLPTLISAIREATGQAILIAEAPPKLMPDIRVFIRRDRLKVMLDVKVPRGMDLTIEHLRHKLKEFNVVFGIDEGALEWIVRTRAGKNVVCASGIMPRDGDEAYIKYHIDLERQGRPVELENGTVDFKNINNFLAVKAGQLILEKIPPTAGVEGMDVFGLPIMPKPGKDIPMPKGKNLTVEDKCRLVAAIDGQICINRNRISVLPTIEIKGDVDYSAGNIDFMGNVIIHGNVQSGFSVKAGGNVEIRGSISGGMVEANDIIVRMGIKGMNRSIIKVRERLVSKYVENATIFADQEIVVSDVVLNSYLYAGCRVIIEGQRGIVIGGRISAGEKIILRTAGNQSHVSTELEVSFNPFLRDEVKMLHAEMKQLNSHGEKLKLSLKYVTEKGLKSLSSDKQQQYQKMQEEYDQLPEKMEDIQNRISDIESILYSLPPGKIAAADMLHPGVKIAIGPLVKTISERFSYCTLYAQEGEIRVGPFK